MAILRFRIYFEEDETVYRDVVIRHSQLFIDLHHQILKSFEFDAKHEATFYRSNDSWQKGREISLQKYDKPYKAEPLLMAETTIGSQSLGPIGCPVLKERKHPPASCKIASGAAMSQGACLTVSELLSWTTAQSPVVPSISRIATPE